MWRGKAGVCLEGICGEGKQNECVREKEAGIRGGE